MRLIITGPPAAGKGSLAPFIVKEYNIKHISTGQMFREEIKKGSKLGLKLKAVLDQGKLVSDDITNEIVKVRLEQDDVLNGFLLDGYPRTINQAIFLDNLLKSKGQKIDYVISLQLSEDIIIKRIVGRMYCPVCGRNYNAYFTKPKIENICDDDGATLVRRTDDTEETARHRLQIYEKQTIPIINYYNEQGIVIIADGGHLLSADTFKEVKDQIGDK